VGGVGGKPKREKLRNTPDGIALALTENVTWLIKDDEKLPPRRKKLLGCKEERNRLSGKMPREMEKKKGKSVN